MEIVPPINKEVKNIVMHCGTESDGMFRVKKLRKITFCSA